MGCSGRRSVKMLYVISDRRAARPVLMRRSRAVKMFRPRFHATDCVEFMGAWRGPRADVVVTSPPYNLAKDYGGYDDRREWSEYLEWTEAWGGGFWMY